MEAILKNDEIMGKVYEAQEFLEELKLLHGVEAYQITEKSAKGEPDSEVLIFGLELEIEESPDATYIMIGDLFDQIINGEIMSISMFLPESVQDIRINKNKLIDATIEIDFMDGNSTKIEATENKLPN
jgi:hypothetical protein